MKSFEQIARAMYAAYKAARSSPWSAPLPEWESVRHEHEGWIAAAKAAYKEIAEVR
ncbi:MAG: hypothetical protein ACRCTX_04715 [Afipia sp.]